MKDLLIYILKNLVDAPDQVSVEETTDDTGLVILKTQVAPTDMGKVIGKEGKVINAIRQVVKIKAIKEGKRVQISLTEVGGGDGTKTHEEEQPAPEKNSPEETPAPEEKPAGPEDTTKTE